MPIRANQARPSAMRNVVVFPDPFGPSRPVTIPARAVKDTSRTAPVSHWLGCPAVSAGPPTR